MDLHTIWSRIISSDELLAVALATVASILGWFALRALRAKIAWSVSHRHCFNLQNLKPPVLAYTNEIWVQNTGREVAEDIEVVFAFRPAYFDLWPQRHYQEMINPDSTFIVKLDNLNPREYVTISVFQAAQEPPNVTNVRFRGGVGKKVDMGPTQIYSRPFRLTVQAIFILGFFSFWYFLFRLI